MRKFRAGVAAVMAAGVMSLGATSCTPPATAEDQARLEAWIASSISGFLYFVLWDWLGRNTPCPNCPPPS